MNTFHHRSRDSHGEIPPFAASRRITDEQNARFFLKDPPHGVCAQTPQLAYFRGRVVLRDEIGTVFAEIRIRSEF
jgi:hypothetical protein